ncbi:MAG TPA: hypothetical protein VK211_13515 [Kamptonema sp.]|nr:hypothetical protein [Kamptonema sp.]
MNNQISDKNLINFLKQNRPTLPEEQPDLEHNIMAAIEQERLAGWSQDRGKISNSFILSRFAKNKTNINKQLWIFPSAIAASLLVAWSGYHTLNPAKLSSTEEAHLEAFLVNNWEGSVDNSNWMPLNFTTDN